MEQTARRVFGTKIAAAGEGGKGMIYENHSRLQQQLYGTRLDGCIQVENKSRRLWYQGVILRLSLRHVIDYARITLWRGTIRGTRQVTGSGRTETGLGRVGRSRLRAGEVSSFPDRGRGALTSMLESLITLNRHLLGLPRSRSPSTISSHVRTSSSTSPRKRNGITESLPLCCQDTLLRISQ
ncbi:hypothetical protein J6590_030745 [Homalodisca vitripennis]|nr:hypothetical protein J6590_030745 [Homalodisca vitripennis]